VQASRGDLAPCEKATGGAATPSGGVAANDQPPANGVRANEVSISIAMAARIDRTFPGWHYVEQLVGREKFH
jgi:hypothetical protein